MRPAQVAMVENAVKLVTRNGFAQDCSSELTTGTTQTTNSRSFFMQNRRRRIYWRRSRNNNGILGDTLLRLFADSVQKSSTSPTLRGSEMSVVVFSVPIDGTPVNFSTPSMGVASISIPGANPAGGISGKWVVWGRVVVENLNINPASVMVALVSESGPFDSVTVSVPAGNGSAQAIALQGIFVNILSDSQPVKIFCASSATLQAQSIQLMAVSVDELMDAEKNGSSVV
jgi:hypothetical protein